MSPFSCPSALTAPGPFDLTAPHILPWLVWPIVVMALVTFPFGGFKTIQHFWRGVREPERRPLWWLRSLRNLCFTIGYPPWGFSVAWMDAIESWKQTLAAQGCTIKEDASLFSTDSYNRFLIWALAGVVLLVAFMVLELFIERKVKRTAKQAQAQKAAPISEEPLGARFQRRDTKDTWLYKSGMVAIVLTCGVGPLIHGIADLQSNQPAYLLPRAKNIAEFALPTPSPAGEAPIEIVAGPDGNLWFTINTGKIGRMTMGRRFTEFALPTSESLPGGITAAPDGNLWFTEVENNKIGRITPAGAITEFALPREGSIPREIAAGVDGNLWFSEENYSGRDSNYIGRITPAGTISEFLLPFPASSALGITAGPDGNVWFTERYSDVIGRITPTGTVTEFLLPTGASPSGQIAAGPDGNLWFTEADSNQIGRITPAGAITQFRLPNGPGKPWQITTGPDGNLWFTDPADFGTSGDEIGRITPGGRVTLFPLGKAGSGPAGIAAGPDGNLWFTEGDTIGRLAPGK